MHQPINLIAFILCGGMAIYDIKYRWPAMLLGFLSLVNLYLFIK